LVKVALLVSNLCADLTDLLIAEVQGEIIATVYNFFATSDSL
jgi:hypothetical protein